jgi:hypothetical protein
MLFPTRSLVEEERRREKKKRSEEEKKSNKTDATIGTPPKKQ